MYCGSTNVSRRSSVPSSALFKGIPVQPISLVLNSVCNLTFIGRCIVIYSYSKTNQMHRSIKFILFWNDTLRVSNGISVHHQEFKTVHTATGICQTDTADCLLTSSQQYLTYASLELLMMERPSETSSNKQYLTYASLELLMMDGKTVRNIKQ